METSRRSGKGALMTDTYIEKTLIDAFMTINDFSGVSLIKTDEKGKPLNVSLPNTPFTPPKDNNFYIISFLPNEPEPAGLGINAENRWNGILQIDIIVPIGIGTDIIAIRYDWIVKLLQRGKTFGEIMIIKTYRAHHGAEPENTTYRTIIRVEFTASLPK